MRTRGVVVVNALADNAASEDPMVNAEASLACAVIENALLEACAPRERGRRTAGFHATPAEREQSWDFCTATSGQWAQSREDWCDAAGIDPGAVRAAALKRGPHPTIIEVRLVREQHGAARAALVGPQEMAA